MPSDTFSGRGKKTTTRLSFVLAKTMYKSVVTRKPLNSNHLKMYLFFIANDCNCFLPRLESGNGVKVIPRGQLNLPSCLILVRKTTDQDTSLRWTGIAAYLVKGYYGFLYHYWLWWRASFNCLHPAGGSVKLVCYLADGTVNAPSSNIISGFTLHIWV